ncbi:MAG: hypothetical protein ACFE0I_17085 [Elainellaceae cyanobacterium]
MKHRFLIRVEKLSCTGEPERYSQNLSDRHSQDMSDRALNDNEVELLLKNIS